MPNKLPLNWCECKFGDVGYLQNGYAFNSKLYKEKGVNLIRISDIQDNEVILDNCVKVSEKVDECFQVHKGDFLLAMSGATTGKTGIYNSEDEALLNQRVGNLKIYDEKVLLPKFRNYFISNKRSLIEKLAYGGAQPNISKAMIEDLDILLPPLAEQERIVAKIEALFQDIDEGVERLKSAQAQIKQYRQSVLKSAFEGKLYKTTDWEKTTIGKVATVGTGATPLKSNSKYYGGNIAWVTSGELNNNFVTSASGYITELAVKETNVTIYPKHTLLIAMYGEGKTRGKCSELLIEAGTNQAIAAIQTKENCINRQYLKMYCLYNYNNIRMQSIGGVQPNLNLTTIKNICFPLPTLPEQQRIVAEIEKRFALADELEKAVNDGLEKADKLKQSILKKAFEGKLVPQDPNDEPASVLLERIKKSQTPTKGKKK